MTHKEYIRILQDVRKRRAGDEVLADGLGRLYEIKPVSLFWNVIKAEKLLEEKGDIGGSYGLLNNLINMDCETEGNIEANKSSYGGTSVWAAM